MILRAGKLRDGAGIPSACQDGSASALAVLWGSQGITWAMCDPSWEHTVNAQPLQRSSGEQA